MRKLFKKGFTLVELVVVVAIIAILSGVSVAVYSGVTDNAKQTACDSEADTIGSVIRIASLEDSDGFDFYYDAGSYVAWNDQTAIDDTHIHYTCFIETLGAKFYSLDASKNATVVTFGDYEGSTPTTPKYTKAGDLLKAVYCIHEGLALDNFIGNGIAVENKNSGETNDNVSTDGKTITGFVYTAKSLKTTAYSFVK